MKSEPGYFTQLSDLTRTLPLAEKRSAEILVVELADNARYIARVPWGTGFDPENPKHSLVRRGAVLTYNQAQKLFAVCNDGVYSARRADMHARDWELNEKVAVTADSRMLVRAYVCARSVRAKDPVSQERYQQALATLESVTPFVRNEHKVKGGELVAKAGSVTDSLGRPNPGRLEALLAAAIPEFAERLLEVGQILVAMDRREAELARYLEEVTQHTALLYAHLSKFVTYVKDGKTLTPAECDAVANRMRTQATYLGYIDALPSRNMYKHVGEELPAIATLVLQNKLQEAAAIAKKTVRSLEYQFFQQDVQELLLFTTLFEDGSIVPSNGKLKAFVDDLEDLLPRLKYKVPMEERDPSEPEEHDLDYGFTTKVVADARANLQLAIDCADAPGGPHFDQINDALRWVVQTT